MRNPPGDMLNGWRRGLLTAAAILTLTAPVALGALKPLPLFAQVPTPAVARGKPAFEVASIRQNASGDSGQLFQAQGGGRVNVVNYTVQGLIQNTYGVRSFLIIGAPDWLARLRFDIVAKADGNAQPREMLVMLRTLLADRFKLTMRTEMREMPIYALLMARNDRKPGPMLRTAAVDCATRYAEALRTGKPSPAEVYDPACGQKVGPGSVVVGGQGLGTLTNSIGNVVGRPVADRTGVKGAFDYQLTFTPDQLSAGSTPPPDFVSIFAALEEQLGLKLESTKRPVDVLVIDHVEQPTPD